MFEGASFIAALQCDRATKGGQPITRRFIGFDSFEGLQIEDDEHGRWTQGEFRTDYERVRRRVGRRFGNKAEFRIVKGFLEDTLHSELTQALELERVAIAMFDLDLREPTRLALDFVRPYLQEGSVLVFDDPFFFRGHPEQGEAGAFEEFRRDNPELEFRRFFDYGFGGRVHVLGRIGVRDSQGSMQK